MPNKFVHICGASGVGKSTLLGRLIDNTNPQLRKRFGVEGVFQAYGDHKHAKNLMYLFFAKESTIVHDWQYVTHGWISHAGRAYPNAEHRIFLLWRPWALTHLALKARSLREGKPEETLEAVILAWREIVPHFQQLKDWGFNVEIVDASTEAYEATTLEAIENTRL